MIFQSLSLEGESSTELVSVAAEPLTSASQLPMGQALHKRGASVRLSQNVRQYLTQKFNIRRDTVRNQTQSKQQRICELLAQQMERECSIEQSGYPTYRFRVSSRDCALNSYLKYNNNRIMPQTQTHLKCEMRYPFSQELSKLMNRDCYANRCDDQMSFVPVSQKSEQSLLYLDVRSIRDNYMMELRDRLTGHGVFHCVLLSPVTLNRSLQFGF